MAYVQAQKLNRRITIEQRLPGQDTYGQPNGEWSQVAKVWAHAKFVTGSGYVSQELQAGGTEVSRAVASFRIRWRSGITAGMRIRSGGQIYDIKVVLPDEQDHRHIDLGVATGANEG